MIVHIAALFLNGFVSWTLRSRIISDLECSTTVTFTDLSYANDALKLLFRKWTDSLLSLLGVITYYSVKKRKKYIIATRGCFDSGVQTP